MMELPEVEITAAVKLPGKRKFEDVEADTLVKTAAPVITNPAAIPKHTKLVVLDDMNLHKLTHKLHEERKRAAAEAGQPVQVRKRATGPAT